MYEKEKIDLLSNKLEVYKHFVFFFKGLGLYAARDIEKHTMVIEYIGTIIRNEVANRKEKLYESQVGVWSLRLYKQHHRPLPFFTPAKHPERQNEACRAASSFKQKQYLYIIVFLSVLSLSIGVMVYSDR